MPERWLGSVGQLTLAGMEDPTEPAALLPRVGWGPYAAAIEEWTAVMGDPPHPVDSDGFLDPPFVEWMMGLPPDWTVGLARFQRLRLLGNAVVPHQAVQAWKALFSGIPLRKRSAA